MKIVTQPTRCFDERQSQIIPAQDDDLPLNEISPNTAQNAMAAHELNPLKYADNPVKYIFATAATCAGSNKKSGAKH